MWNASPAKAAAYGKASSIGLLLTVFQLFIFFLVVASRTLGADTMHSAGDLITLGGTTLLLWRTWENEAAYLNARRRWLLVGVWSLVLGGLFVAGESLHDLLGGAEGTVRSWTLPLVALVSAGGNWWMHHIIHCATHEDQDALDRNNLDHMFWDGVLSLAVFVSYLFGTALIDRLIAIVIGGLVLPYLAWKRWKEDGERDNLHNKKHAHPH